LTGAGDASYSGPKGVGGRLWVREVPAPHRGPIRSESSRQICDFDTTGWIMGTPSRIERICLDKGLKMTEQRRVIARVLSDATDHPDVEQVYRRATEIDPRISIATVYRTVRLFEEASILERHDFRDGRSRYEETPEIHHDHLIDIQSGRVIEFRDEQIEQLQRKVAEKLGYRLVDHRLELYAVPINESASRTRQPKETDDGRRS
jgi:Fur family ferric uptake transcriptional regulator